MLWVIFTPHSKSHVDKEISALTFPTERIDNRWTEVTSHANDTIHLQQIPGGSHILERGDFHLKKLFGEICDKAPGSVTNFVKAIKCWPFAHKWSNLPLVAQG